MLRAQRRDPAKAQAKCAFATNYPLANRQLRSPLILRYRMQRDKPFRRLLCGLTLLACAPALAGDPVTVTISQKDCRRLALHTPAPDVAYKGGVDARGKKVAPADIGGQKPLRLPDVLQFEVERELVDLPGETTGDLQAGTVRYNINSGRLTYNGQPLNDPMVETLVGRCRDALGQ